MSTLFTIGYGGRTPDEFVRLLCDAGVKVVADVRLRPDRAHLGSFVRSKDPEKGIEGLLKRSGVGYQSLVELGNVFLDHEDWQWRYRQLLDRTGDLLLERLLRLESPVCMLCAEKRHEECHRHLIAERLVAKGIEVQHL